MRVDGYFSGIIIDMKAKIFLYLFSLIPTFSMAESCLPKLIIKATQAQCKINQDCVLVGDSCRSCGEPRVANKKFKKDIEALDQKKRESIGCVLSCEACSQQSIETICQNSQCTFKKVP